MVKKMEEYVVIEKKIVTIIKRLSKPVKAVKSVKKVKTIEAVEAPKPKAVKKVTKPRVSKKPKSVSIDWKEIFNAS